MLRTGELLLVAAGFACGFYGYLVRSSDERSDLAAITRISAAPDRDYGRTYRDSMVIPTFAPTTTTIQKIVVSHESDSEPVAAVLPKPSSWTTVVLVTGQPVVSPVRSSRAADFETRSQLASDLQRELQRAGCYQGEITGNWTASARRAMAAFMDRANAVLPYSQPDYVLLALVQSHREIACSADCPSGQVMSESGRCLPRVVVAQAEKKSKRLEERRLAAARLDGERNRDNVAAAQQPEVLPWLRTASAAAPAPEVALVSPSGLRPDPLRDSLPGRMSFGGPPIDVALAPSASNTISLSGEASSRANDAASSNSDGGVRTNTPKFAALQSDPDADNLSDSGTASLPADMPAAAIDSDAPIHKSRKTRHSDKDSRPRHNSYAYESRRGPPRPGSLQYNVMRTLGNFY